MPCVQRMGEAPWLMCAREGVGVWLHTDTIRNAVNTMLGNLDVIPEAEGELSGSFKQESGKIRLQILRRILTADMDRRGEE